MPVYQRNMHGTYSDRLRQQLWKHESFMMWQHFNVTHLPKHLLAAAELPQVCDRGVGVHWVRASAWTGPLGSPHRFPPGQVHAGNDRGALQNAEEDGSQWHVLHPLSVHPWDRAKHQLSPGNYFNSDLSWLSAWGFSTLIYFWEMKLDINK